MEFPEMKRAGRLILRCGLMLMAAWATLAIVYSGLPVAWRAVLAGLFGLGSLAALTVGFRHRLARLGFAAAFAAVLVWWLNVPASNDRPWQPDLAVLSWAEIAGSRVTIHNIRNCDYRTETDFTVRSYDKTFDLDQLDAVDLFLVHWGSPAIAHTMLSFGFKGGEHVVFSIETRKVVGEAYSTLKGFFRVYELIYVVADERDVVRLRTNYRKEEVYLYRLKAAPLLAREVFLHYLGEVNRLARHPEWYNALTANCTTSIRKNTAPYNPDARFDWRLIVNGYLDEMLYERGEVDRTLPFAELKQRSFINPAAQAAGQDPDFSRLIRAGRPGMETK